MKKRIFLALILMTTNIINAQEIPLDLIDRANAVEFIFEGQVLETHPYYSDNGQYIRTSNVVLITKILKGDIGCGTVEIITNGGELEGRELELSHSLELHEGNMGLFLCDLTDRPLSVVDFYPEANLEKLEGKFENQSFIRYWWDGEELNAADIWLNFDSLALMYNLAELVTGLTFIDCYPGSNSPIEEVESNLKKSNLRNSLPLVTIQIDDFNPKSVRGGVGDVVTIVGSGFENIQGTGNIYLKDANDGGVSEIFLDDEEIILWTDSLIKFQVPSYSTSTCTNCASNKGRPAGTGLIKVVNNSGDIKTSLDTLKTRYSVYNSEDKEAYIISPWIEMNKKFIFRCDTSVSNYNGGNMKIVLQKAIDDWVCLTGVDWELGPDTIYSNTDALQDKICTIHFKNYTDSVNTLMATATRRDFQYNSTFTDKSFSIFEVDMIINSDYSYYCDTSQSTTSVPNGQIDFYSIALHEFGHAIGLNHVIDNSAIMYHSISPTTRNINLPSDASCDEGGNWMANYTTDLNNPLYGTFFNRMEFDSINPCSQNLSISDLYVSEHIDVNIYPNPCSNILTIDIGTENDFLINVYDIHGKIQIETNKGASEIQVGHLSKGVYILRIHKPSVGLIGVAKFFKQ